jgi:hypothetical protein
MHCTHHDVCTHVTRLSSFDPDIVTSWFVNQCNRSPLKQSSRRSRLPAFNRKKAPSLNGVFGVGELDSVDT